MCYTKKHSNILFVHEHATWGFVSRNVKLALTLRLLAGGLYIDLALLLDVGFSTACEIFYNVIKHWIWDDCLGGIRGIDYCENETIQGELRWILLLLETMVSMVALVQ